MFLQMFHYSSGDPEELQHFKGQAGKEGSGATIGADVGDQANVFSCTAMCTNHTLCVAITYCGNTCRMHYLQAGDTDSIAMDQVVLSDNPLCVYWDIQ